MNQASQLPLFELPQDADTGWRPQELLAGAQVHWLDPKEAETRLDAPFYVLARRPERTLRVIGCGLNPLQDWVEINPTERRLPVERGYWIFETCIYSEIRSVRDGCWLVGPGLPEQKVREVPGRAAYKVQPGDILLPRIYSSLHRAVMVQDNPLPLVASDAFALLMPCSVEHGLALLALLHHRLLGEQLWALASGTTVRAVSASKLAEIRVPALAIEQVAELAAQTRELLRLQYRAHFPEASLPVRRYWSEGPVTYWQRQAQEQALQFRRPLTNGLG